MSCQEIEADAAFRMCTGILLCREEFGSKDSGLGYNFLHRLVAQGNLTNACKKFFKFTFAYSKYDLRADDWKPNEKSVDVINILTEYKLNHEEQDYTSLLLKQVSSRCKGESVTRRVFAAVTGNINSRSFAEYLDLETSGMSAVRATKILRLAQAYTGPYFTDAFDKRSFYLPTGQQEARKRSRLLKVVRLELSREVPLKQSGWRRRFCIQNKSTCGALIGKNIGASLTMNVGTGGYSRNDGGVIPGPGARSGYAFICGGVLGMQGDSNVNGILCKEYDATKKDRRPAYKHMPPFLVL